MLGCKNCRSAIGFTGVAAMLLLPFLLTACPVESRVGTLTILNDSPFIVTSMTMRPLGRTWTPDQLGGAGLAGNGASVEIANVAVGTYDLRAQLQTGGGQSLTVQLDGVLIDEEDYTWRIWSPGGTSVNSEFVLSDDIAQEVDLAFYEILDGTSNAAGAIEGDSGDQVVVLGDKDDFGRLTDTLGGGFRGGEGGYFFYWLNENGVLKYAVSSGWVFEYSELTASTFDLAAYGPNGEEEVFLGVGYAEETKSLTAGAKAWNTDWKDAVNEAASVVDAICCPTLEAVGLDSICCETDFVDDVAEVTTEGSDWTASITSSACTSDEATPCGTEAQAVIADLMEAENLLEDHVVNAPAQGTQRSLDYAGQSWWALGSPGEPDGNAFDGSPDTVTVRGDALTLKIRQDFLTWYCSRVVSARSATDGSGWFADYGTYRLWVEGPVDDLDANVVFEFGLLQGESLGAQFAAFAPEGAYLDANPSDANGEVRVLSYEGVPDEPGVNSVAYTSDLNPPETTLIIEWTEDFLRFAQYQGFVEDEAAGAAIRASVQEFTPEDLGDVAAFPVPADNLAVEMRLWLLDADPDGIGDPPTHGQDVAVTIRDFAYTPPAEEEPDDN